MIAEMLETILTGAVIFLLVVFTVACYYVAYRMFRDYREDAYMKGDKVCLYGGLGLIFCGTIMSLILLMRLAQEMGW